MSDMADRLEVAISEKCGLATFPEMTSQFLFGHFNRPFNWTSHLSLENIHIKVYINVRMYWRVVVDIPGRHRQLND